MINNIFDLNFRKLKMTQKAGRAPGGAQGENGAGSDTQPLETGLSVPDKESCSATKTLKVVKSGGAAPNAAGTSALTGSGTGGPITRARKWRSCKRAAGRRCRGSSPSRDESDFTGTVLQVLRNGEV